ncbi:hypothetical protein F4679DRAFT_597249 [Xylaria curta]|nr:hypothetical protein F4679DRAFT_597249 [Xylaria curta]
MTPASSRFDRLCSATPTVTVTAATASAAPAEYSPTAIVVAIPPSLLLMKPMRGSRRVTTNTLYFAVHVIFTLGFLFCCMFGSDHRFFWPSLDLFLFLAIAMRAKHIEENFGPKESPNVSTIFLAPRPSSSDNEDAFKSLD